MLLSRIILDLVKKRNDEQEKIIKQAFELHFGFPIEKADKSKLYRATVFGSTIEQYRYKEETFLLWDNSLEQFEIEKDPECPVCRGEYKYYGKVSGAHTVSMCGKDSMQIIPSNEGEVDFEKYARVLEHQGKVKYTKYTLDFDDGDVQIKLFKTGRAIIKHVSDEKRARAVYAEYIGL